MHHRWWKRVGYMMHVEWKQTPAAAAAAAAADRRAEKSRKEYFPRPADRSSARQTYTHTDTHRHTDRQLPFLSFFLSFSEGKSKRLFLRPAQLRSIHHHRHRHHDHRHRSLQTHTDTQHNSTTAQHTEWVSEWVREARLYYAGKQQKSWVSCFCCCCCCCCCRRRWSRRRRRLKMLNSSF